MSQVVYTAMAACQCKKGTNLLTELREELSAIAHVENEPVAKLKPKVERKKNSK